MAPRNKNNRNFFKRRRPRSDADRVRAKKIRSNRMKKGIFILPSLLTLTSIFLGFYGIISAIKGQFVLAGALILVAGFFDGVDGKVARLTKTTTRFGLELDSLADVISFGVAPALLMYMWALEPYGRIGWVTAFVFVACGALRLARFNVQSGSIDPKVFYGLPIPAAAAVISSLVLFCQKLAINPLDYGIPLLLLTYILAFFMVSSVKFHAFKDLTLVKQKPFSSTVAFVLVLALVAASPFVVPFLICAAYLVSGPILTAVLISRRKKMAVERAPEDQQAEGELEPKPAAPRAE